MTEAGTPLHMRPERSFQGLILALQRYYIQGLLVGSVKG